MAKETGNGKGKARDTKNNIGRLAAFAQGASEDGPDWGDCEAEWLQTVVVSIARLGGAATFGMNRDNSSLSLTLLLDDHRKTLWYNTGEDLNDALKLVIGTLDQMDVP